MALMFTGLQNHPELLAQSSEFIVVITTLECTLAEPINILCDSTYVVNVISHLETTTIKGILDTSLFNLFL